MPMYLLGVIWGAGWLITMFIIDRLSTRKTRDAAFMIKLVSVLVWPIIWGIILIGVCMLVRISIDSKKDFPLGIGKGNNAISKKKKGT